MIFYDKIINHSYYVSLCIFYEIPVNWQVKLQFYWKEIYNREEVFR